jgi:RNA polymerase sigma-70 factor (ECF subfamily)
MLERLENIVDDSALVRAARLGRTEAFQQLAREYDHSILRLAWRITGSDEDAKSIYRETFLKLHGELGYIDSGNAVCVATYRIAAGLCLEYLRRRNSKTPSRPAVHTLSPHERLVLELKHYQRLKLRTVSEILNTTEETVRNIFFRATQKLH